MSGSYNKKEANLSIGPDFKSHVSPNSTIRAQFSTSDSQRGCILTTVARYLATPCNRNLQPASLPILPSKPHYLAYQARVILGVGYVHLNILITLTDSREDHLPRLGVVSPHSHLVSPRNRVTTPDLIGIHWVNQQQVIAFASRAHAVVWHTDEEGILTCILVKICLIDSKPVCLGVYVIAKAADGCLVPHGIDNGVLVGLHWLSWCLGLFAKDEVVKADTKHPGYLCVPEQGYLLPLLHTRDRWWSDAQQSGQLLVSIDTSSSDQSVPLGWKLQLLLLLIHTCHDIGLNLCHKSPLYFFDKNKSKVYLHIFYINIPYRWEST